MSCDGYCGCCGEPYNFNETTQLYEYGCECSPKVVEANTEDKPCS